MMQLQELVRLLESWFPLPLAEDWDNVGLLLGDRSQNITRVMTCLTLTPDVADEAIAERANLIITHHPIFFRPVKRLLADGPDGHIYRLACAGVAVYSPHTAFDGAENGINEQIATRLGLTDVRPIRPESAEPAVKLIIFVPESDHEKVAQAAFRAGAGIIGKYHECSFTVAGTGTFFGTEGTNPTVGEAGRREAVPEHRLEIRVPSRRVDAVMQAIRKAHPYEEPAYDIVPLQATETKVGSGRIGRLPRPLKVASLAKKVKELLRADTVQWAGVDRSCSTVAVGCGAGDDFLGDADRAGADVLLTGEARFHRCLEARSRSMGLILAGHYATERFALETLAQRLADESLGLYAWPSSREHDPLHRV